MLFQELISSLEKKETSEPFFEPTLSSPPLDLVSVATPFPHAYTASPKLDSVATLCSRGKEKNVRLHAAVLMVVFKSSIMFCKGQCTVIARLFETGSVVLISVFIQHTFIHFLLMSYTFRGVFLQVHG